MNNYKKNIQLCGKSASQDPNTGKKECDEADRGKNRENIRHQRKEQ